MRESLESEGGSAGLDCHGQSGACLRPGSTFRSCRVRDDETRLWSVPVRVVETQPELPCALGQRVEADLLEVTQLSRPGYATPVEGGWFEPAAVLVRHDAVDSPHHPLRRRRTPPQPEDEAVTRSAEARSVIPEAGGLPATQHLPPVTSVELVVSSEGDALQHQPRAVRQLLPPLRRPGEQPDQCSSHDQRNHREREPEESAPPRRVAASPQVLPGSPRTPVSGTSLFGCRAHRHLGRSGAAVRYLVRGAGNGDGRPVRASAFRRPRPAHAGAPDSVDLDDHGVDRPPEPVRRDVGTHGPGLVHAHFQSIHRHRG